MEAEYAKFWEYALGVLSKSPGRVQPGRPETPCSWPIVYLHERKAAALMRRATIASLCRRVQRALSLSPIVKVQPWPSRRIKETLAGIGALGQWANSPLPPSGKVLWATCAKRHSLCGWPSPRIQETLAGKITMRAMQAFQLRRALLDRKVMLVGPVPMACGQTWVLVRL